MWKPLSESWPYGPAIAATAADILGQAIVTPALPFYLDQIGLPEADLPRWSGLIMGTQFAAVVLGSLISGRVGDTYGSAAAVRLALRGQVFFFALSAFAPFGVVGDPKLAVILLLLTRIGAGVSTALVSALLYIFDRAPSSQALLRGVAQYMGTLSCMWAAGGLIVGFLYDTVGWRWLNLGSAGVAGLAFVYNILLPTPSLQKAGPNRKSEGVSNALCSAEFASHAWTAFNMGWSFNAHIFIMVLSLKHFGFSARSIGFCFLLVPVGILPTVFILPLLTRRFGLNACITSGCLANVVLCTVIALPDVCGHSVALIIGLGLGMFFTLTQHNANQARAKMIATKYAKNATGAVTGVSRTCFSLGQATGPLVSGLIWNWSVSGPYLLLAAVHLSQILVMVATRTRLWRDPVEDEDTSFVKAITRTAMPRSIGSVLNLTLLGDAPGSNFTNATPVTPPNIVELDSVHIEENGADKEAISPSGLAPSITRVRRPSYSRLAAPPAVRPSARPRTRRPTHVVDLAYGRARIDASVPDASVPAQSLSVPSQRHNALPTEA